jgi:hypothetical protein
MQAQPATNLELQKWIARKHGFLVDASWIEQGRRMLDVAPGPAEAPENQVEVIPPEKLVAIKQALRHFGMLR